MTIHINLKFVLTAVALIILMILAQPVLDHFWQIKDAIDASSGTV